MVSGFEAVYADGWDDGLVNPLTRAAAGARDAAGEPYTVVLLEDGERHAVMNLSWGDAYCRVSRYDPARRRVSTHEFRGTPDGDLFLRRARTWDGPPDVNEFEYPHVAARTCTTYRLDGECTTVSAPHGDRGSEHESHSVRPPPRLPIPGFGQWQGLLRIVGDGPADVVDAVGDPLPARTGDGPPWRPPRPLLPDGIEDLFIPGTLRTYDDRQFRLSVHAAGSLRLPTGRLIAADPSALDHGAGPFTVTVAPGTYPVTLGLATFVDDPGHTRITAARLDVGDQPPVSWELALCDGQDPIDLGYREYFGFGVDAGMACFVDAATRDRVRDLWRTLDGLVPPGCRSVGAGDMVIWSSGWGDGAYPTWIGYDATGGVACFVADMLLLSGDEGDEYDDYDEE